MALQMQMFRYNNMSRGLRAFLQPPEHQPGYNTYNHLGSVPYNYESHDLHDQSRASSSREPYLDTLERQTQRERVRNAFLRDETTGARLEAHTAPALEQEDDHSLSSGHDDMGAEDVDQGVVDERGLILPTYDRLVREYCNQTYQEDDVQLQHCAHSTFNAFDPDQPAYVAATAAGSSSVVPRPAPSSSDGPVVIAQHNFPRQETRGSSGASTSLPPAAEAAALPDYVFQHDHYRLQGFGDRDPQHQGHHYSTGPRGPKWPSRGNKFRGKDKKFLNRDAKSFCGVGSSTTCTSGKNDVAGTSSSGTAKLKCDEARDTVLSLEAGAALIERKNSPSPYRNEVSDAGFAYTYQICLAESAWWHFLTLFGYAEG